MSPAIAEAPAKANAKGAKESKSKKAYTAPKKARSHPPYSEMISEAIVALKERTGSSQIAIAKFLEEKNKSNLPSNFKKLLFVQLKKLVASGKLVKVKNSFKHPPKSTAVSDAKAPKAPATSVAKPKAKNEASSKRKFTGVKGKSAALPKAKKVAKTVTAKSPGKKDAKSAVVKTPVKKAAVGSIIKKKTPVKGAKKPKSIKSPAKNAQAARAKK